MLARSDPDPPGAYPSIDGGPIRNPIGGLSRRAFFGRSTRAVAEMVAEALVLPEATAVDGASRVRFGLAAHRWAGDWDVPTLLRNCSHAGVQGVELRAGDGLVVEPQLGGRARTEIRLRFQNGSVELIGLDGGSALHGSDPDLHHHDVETASQLLQLSHDLGGSGVRLRSELPADEAATGAIARTLRELGRRAAELGQEVRLEVEGAGGRPWEAAERILAAVDHPGVTCCWSRAALGLAEPGPGNRPAGVVYVDRVDPDDQQLFDLLTRTGYGGWLVLEADNEPLNRVQALVEQRARFAELLARAGDRSRGH